jgi:L-seryl-tRNA(Ser) seleniumtransferase
MNPSPRRAIPSVEKLLESLAATDLPRPAVVAVVRRELAALRQEPAVPPFPQVLARVQSALDALRRARLQPVINGTGILLHTNLGRAPLGPAVIAALESIAANYSNLEYDLAGGERGHRAAYLEHNLALLCGAEAATVVNNCAAALVLVLRHFAAPPRPEVVISRGELVQIGGGFRIPEILAASGASLREVGATNKTTLLDYAQAISPRTALLLKVHRSNFFMGGFVESPATEDLAALARRKKIPFVEDLGSGALVPTEKIGEVGRAVPASRNQVSRDRPARLPQERQKSSLCSLRSLPLNNLEHEPTPAEVLRRGVGLVTFSGDKLLGGPQAGIIAGKARWIAALKREPFFRALRCDKLILAALQTTVDLYLAGRPADSVPVLQLMSLPMEQLTARANALVARLAALPLRATLGQGKAQIGGGTLPRSLLPSVTLDLLPARCPLPEFAARLRRATPPVIGYLGAARFKLDLRTIFPAQDELLLQALQAAAR